ncbi:MAG: DUF2249 domain-containing protein [Thiomargarita sp.]|nr:DUF2249 domain-containing protein [Thiomargarita sp.]
MNKRTLDVSDLEPCEPLERILAILPQLQAGEYLQVLHRMEPYKLYPILDQQDYAWLTKPGKKAPVEIYIWRKTDDATIKAAIKAEIE